MLVYLEGAGMKDNDKNYVEYYDVNDDIVFDIDDDDVDHDVDIYHDDFD